MYPVGENQVIIIIELFYLLCLSQTLTKLDVVEWLDPTHASAGAYFKDIGNALVSAGYNRNSSIRGAPYDFRKGPST